MACSLLAGACSKQPPVLTIGRIVLATPRALDDQSQQIEAIRSGVSARLSEDGSVKYKPQARPGTYLLHVEVGERVDMEGQENDGVPVEVRLRPTGDGVEYLAVGRGLPVVNPSHSALSGFDDAWQIISQQRQLDIADDARLIGSLSHPDMRLRGFAIERLGERKSKAAVEPLCALLASEPEPELVLRIVGSLVSIRDPRAVAPLIELTQHKDPQFVVQVIFALSAIGGTTAEAYLVTLASGHPIELVRKSAEDALAEMKKPADSTHQP